MMIVYFISIWFASILTRPIPLIFVNLGLIFLNSPWRFIIYRLIYSFMNWKKIKCIDWVIEIIWRYWWSMFACHKIFVLFDDFNYLAKLLKFFFGAEFFQFFKFFLVQWFVFIVQNLFICSQSHIFEEFPHCLCVVKEPDTFLYCLVWIVFFCLQFVVYLINLLELFTVQILIWKIDLYFEMRQFLFIFEFELD